MKVFSQEWSKRVALHEGDADIGAGELAMLPTLASSTLEESLSANVIDLKLAFSQLVSMLRRKRIWTIERLAKEANVEPAELVAIERDPGYRPSPRTVYQLSSVFSVSNKAMLRLAGLRQERDKALAEAAVRFAASAESIEKLSKEETEALDAFVSVLSDRSSER